MHLVSIRMDSGSFCNAPTSFSVSSMSRLRSFGGSRNRYFLRWVKKNISPSGRVNSSAPSSQGVWATSCSKRRRNIFKHKVLLDLCLTYGRDNACFKLCPPHHLSYQRGPKLPL